MDGLSAIIILFVAIITGAAAAMHLEKSNLGMSAFYAAACLFNLATYAFQIQS